MPGKRRAVFLDRDGVLNRAHLRGNRPFPPSSLREMEILPGVPAACAQLRAAGFLLVVVTNQPDLARGTTDRGVVDEINHTLEETLRLDAVMVCPHDDSDQCHCRKPLPGLLLQAAAQYDIDVGGSFMIGDRWRDIEAGQRAGCRTVFIDYQYAERRPSAPDITAASLLDAAHWIIHQSSHTGVVHGA